MANRNRQVGGDGTGGRGRGHGYGRGRGGGAARGGHPRGAYAGGQAWMQGPAPPQIWGQPVGQGPPWGWWQQPGPRMYGPPQAWGQPVAEGPPWGWNQLGHQAYGPPAIPQAWGRPRGTAPGYFQGAPGPVWGFHRGDPQWAQPQGPYGPPLPLRQGNRRGNRHGTRGRRGQGGHRQGERRARRGRRGQGGHRQGERRARRARRGRGGRHDGPNLLVADVENDASDEELSWIDEQIDVEILDQDVPEPADHHDLIPLTGLDGAWVTIASDSERLRSAHQLLGGGEMVVVLIPNQGPDLNWRVNMRRVREALGVDDAHGEANQPRAPELVALPGSSEFELSDDESSQGQGLSGV
ncbi:hypothetical protein FZEAL_3651 [Fusarium zealandicum]|uniref:Uncharacterized protein n=1 Tax=Fusarium zealandicum TaxID=1053134 RepID=A0A8H4XM93_9HYPO|nr:hypothetical protein FZEAL_3651 [Fusarium zealandicum]